MIRSISNDFTNQLQATDIQLLIFLYTRIFSFAKQKKTRIEPFMSYFPFEPKPFSWKS